MQGQYTPTGLKVVQLDLDGNFIGRFDSPGIASKTLEIPQNKIHANCIGRSIRCGDNIFVWEEYYNPEKNYSYKHLKFIKNAKRKVKKEAKSGSKARQLLNISRVQAESTQDKPDVGLEHTRKRNI